MKILAIALAAILIGSGIYAVVASNSKEKPKYVTTTEESVQTTTTAKEVEQEKIEETKQEELPKADNGVINLTASSKENGIYLSWAVQELEAPFGFKIVKSLTENPEYPGDAYIYLSDENSRNYTWEMEDGKKWYFRVCKYSQEGTCTKYSNNAFAVAPTKEVVEEPTDDVEVKSISLDVSKVSDDKVKLKWSINGKSEKGFKVVWSKDKHPEYPSRENDEYHYYAESSKRDDTVDDLDSGDKYYFRVCEYLGGKCGVYSNEVSIEMD